MTSPSIEASQLAYKKQLSLLRSLFRKANRADENLGQYKIGPSLCRVTPESARDVMRAFTRAEALFSPASDVDIERHFVDLGSGRSLVCLAALVHWQDPTMRATGWEINEAEHEWASKWPLVPKEWRDRLELVNGDARFFSPREACAWWGSHADAGLARHQRLFVYCFSKDWGVEARAAVLRALLRETPFWSVFITSDDLAETLADEKGGFTEEERDAAHTLLRGPVDRFDVTLSVSGERHRMYVYVTTATN